MRLLVFLALCTAAVSAVPSLTEDWDSFKSLHGKKYSGPREEYRRLGIYLRNVQRIEEHNEKYKKGLASFTMKINHFGDMLEEEISTQLNGFNRTGAIRKRNPDPSFLSPMTTISLPASLDWREKGAVTPVKNQGNCGGCWAFSATGALEAQTFLKTGSLVPLSEQNLIDCANRVYDNYGCNGGLMDHAFYYIMKNGVESEESYPYEGVDGVCRFNKSNIAATQKSYVDIPPTEEDLMKAVANIGPISVGIKANLASFFYYSGGVFDDPACDNNLDHGVLVVGYGEENGKKYWLLKNSWTAKWGEEGYFKLIRGQNMCGVALMPSYPVV
uniref:Cathepsin L12 n=1 Tax=Dysdercus peruvianus TaxID=685034 RepID=A0A7S6R1C4_9HEMI|nr:cathepsin L12 [Dysdercus peruvianus]